MLRPLGIHIQRWKFQNRHSTWAHRIAVDGASERLAAVSTKLAYIPFREIRLIFARVGICRES
jgi:hypothetical protein